MATINVLDNALDYNIPVSEDASAVQGLSATFPEADTNLDNLTNHITDDLGGTEGKSALVTLDGTAANMAARDGQSLDGVFTGPDRYILQDDSRVHGAAGKVDATNGSVEDVVGYANKLRDANCLNQSITDKNSANPQAWVDSSVAANKVNVTAANSSRVGRNGSKLYTNADGTVRESLKTMPWDIALPKSKLTLRTNIDVDYDLDPDTNNFTE